MLSEKETTRISKFLSYVLRHHPDAIGIELDENGWTNVDLLMQKSNENGTKINIDLLKYVVETNTKKRFEFNADLSRIRASQGHSVEVDLNYVTQKPPAILYHGTGEKSVGSILKTGIEKRDRHHVHLSADYETAVAVGKRHGKPVVLEVLSGKMYEEGISFFLSTNGVWLTDYVAPTYIKLTD
jgi:putative RNA 2'-phosphotransferase